VRLSQFQFALASRGIDLQISSLLDNDYLECRYNSKELRLMPLVSAYLHRVDILRSIDSSDLSIIYAELLPLLPAWLEKRLLGSPYILDFDDAFFLKYRTGRLRWLRPLLGCKFDRLLQGASAVTAGSSHLGAYAQQFNPNVNLVPSVVDTDRYSPCDYKHNASSFTVGWIGSPSTAPYLQALEEPLRNFALEHPVRLLVVGATAPAIPGVEVVTVPWSLELEVELIQQFSVGVMPLPDTPWARGKCAYKLIQCMACAVPVIASPVGANVEVVPPTCGILASTTDQWLAAFRKLAADRNLCLQMGSAGRQWVEENYSLRSAVPELARVIRSVASGRPNA
jgi:glycosyltransferase involved in cell wall biosynthesis